MARVAMPDGLEDIKIEDIPLAAEALANAIGGTESNEPELNIEWMVGPHFKDQWNDDDRKEIHKFFATMAVAPAVYFRKAAPTNLVIAARSKDGKIAAVMIAMLLPASKIAQFCPCCLDFGACFSLLRSVSVVPPWRKKCSDKLKAAGPGMEKRMKACAAVVDPIHAKDAVGRHWYLSLVGVDPKYQGQGLGGKLVRYLNAQADADKLPCYLQCTGTKNPKVYEKCGYAIMGAAHEVSCKDDEDGARICRDFFSMVRPGTAGHTE